MKYLISALTVSVIMSAPAAAQVKGKTTTTKPKTTAGVKPAPSNLKSGLDSFSYALGINIASNLKQSSIDVLSYAALQKGMEDIFKGRAVSLTEQQTNEIVQKNIQKNAMKKVDAEKAKGKAFLEANKKRSGVTTLPNGLQYEVLVKGDQTSAMPKAQDTFVAHYAGTLIDGKEFDNSYKRGEPLQLPVGSVIPGWTQALQLMHIGDKWKVYIPSDLGYGDRGAGADIPGGATLVFEMELVGIKPVAAPAAPVEEPKKEN
ncbi:MAG: FKBP-type peptidyl-prolyl cis-trans isomerase [Ferruginibacter sp.]